MKRKKFSSNLGAFFTGGEHGDWVCLIDEGVPWTFYAEGSTRFWVHYGLVILGFVLAVITLISQWSKPAPYGKHENESAGNWGPPIPLRLGHVLSDVIPGLLLFLLVFFLYGDVREYPNYVFTALWLCHYIHRGVIFPLTMRYRSRYVPLGITLGGLVPNCLYHFINADFVGSADFNNKYYYDPRFIIGVLLYIVGYCINKWADWKLRSLRHPKKQPVTGSCNGGYYIPYGGLFELVSCPNYLGEMVEWLGWAIATWSPAGAVWALFATATFLPRSRHNHQWYKSQFDDYPPGRRALIPFVY